MKGYKYMMAAMAIAASLPAAYGERALETLELTDGTILNGYTKEYNADGTRIFCTESVIYTLPVDSAEKVLTGEQRIILDKLDGDFLEFRRDNPELFTNLILKGKKDATAIRTASYARNIDSNPTPVLVTNLDSRDKKQFVVLTRQDINITPVEVKQILYFPDQNAKVGLYDVIVDKNGTPYYGFKTEENIDNDDIKLELGGTVVYLDYDTIVSVGYKPIDEDTDILEQSPWIKVYKFKNGESVSGVATVIDYVNGKIKIATPGSSYDTSVIREFSIDDYAGYTTKRNEDAVKEPTKKLDFTGGQLYVNNKEVSPLKIEVKNGKFVIKSEQAGTVFPIIDATTRRNAVTVAILNGEAGQAAILQVHPTNSKGDFEVDMTDFDTTKEIYKTISTGKEGETIYTFGERLEPGKYILLVRGLDRSEDPAKKEVIGRFYPFAVDE